MITLKFSKREEMLLTVTVIIVAATIAYSFVIDPVAEAFSRLNRQIETGLLKLDKSYKLLQMKEQINREYQEYAGYIKPLRSEEEEMASMLKAIESIARKNKISITNIRPQAVKTREFYREFVFELNAETDVGSLSKFIYELQSSENLLRVTRLTLTTSYTKDKALKAIMEITKPSLSRFEL
ncbi:MAG: type 4a pilus biogenesis protein PilO [Candidatus Omnitrophica bacterium]|nr:type 4a pilus biogenesis protein PilO [Candidatus Omnitrophota bacterium]